MKKMLLTLAVAILAVGMAGCITTDEPEPTPAKPLEKKVDDLNRKVEEIQALLADLKQSPKGPAAASDTLISCWRQNPPSLAKPQPKPAPERIPMVNTRNLRLSYDLVDVGKSDVAKIEVWATQDTTVWRKLVEQAPSNPPLIQAQVEKEGRWGFKLIALSTIGRGEPAPERGHQPDFWVEVDETKPSVIMYAPDVSGSPETGQMTIRWTADDRHLAERPISISYSIDGQLWRTLVNGLANEGRYVWNIPPELPQAQCYIRIEAVDQAGNVGSAQTPGPIITDLSIPKAKIKSVEMPAQSTFSPVTASSPGAPSSIVPVTAIEPAPASPSGPYQYPGPTRATMPVALPIAPLPR